MKKLQTKEWIAVVVAIAVVGFFFVFGPSLISFFNTVGAFPQKAPVATTTPQISTQDTVVGAGAVAQVGDTVTVNYIGHLPDGSIFDSSVARNEPLQFVLGSGKVIEGFDRGVVGMAVGGKRIVTIPPEMGYGATDYGPIPGNSTLTFEVELLKIQN